MDVHRISGIIRNSMFRSNAIAQLHPAKENPCCELFCLFRPPFCNSLNHLVYNLIANRSIPFSNDIPQKMLKIQLRSMVIKTTTPESADCLETPQLLLCRLEYLIAAVATEAAGALVLLLRDLDNGDGDSLEL